MKTYEFIGWEIAPPHDGLGGLLVLKVRKEYGAVWYHGVRLPAFLEHWDIPMIMAQVGIVSNHENLSDPKELLLGLQQELKKVRSA